MLYSVDSSNLGRLDYESLPQQALMEMVVSQMSDLNQKRLKDKNGNFLDLSEWEGVYMNEDSTIKKVIWGFHNRSNTKPKNQGRICLEWLPESVEVFKINFRGFEGELDCSKLPKELRDFRIYNNRWKGED